MSELVVLASDMLAVAELVLTSLSFLLVSQISRKAFPELGKRGLLLVRLPVILYFLYALVFLFFRDAPQQLFASFNVFFGSVLLLFAAVIAFFEVRKALILRGALRV